MVRSCDAPGLPLAAPRRERRPAAREVLQPGRGRETRSVVVRESVTSRGERAKAKILDPMQDTARGRGKAQSKQRGGIGVVGAGNHLGLKAAQRFKRLGA